MAEDAKKDLRAENIEELVGDINPNDLPESAADEADEDEEGFEVYESDDEEATVNEVSESTEDKPASDPVEDEAAADAKFEEAGKDTDEPETSVEKADGKKAPRFITGQNKDEDPVQHEAIGQTEIDRINTKRRAVLATGNERRKLYKEDHIVGFAGDTVDTEVSKLRQESMTLAAALKSVPPTILECEVMGLTDTTNGVHLLRLKMKNSDGLIPIYVPAEHFMTFPEDGRFTDNPRLLINELRSRIGQQARVTIAYFDEERRFAYGNRLNAMEIDGNHYYKARSASNPSLLFAGAKCNARIVSVRSDRLTVECCGAEAVLKSADLSHHSIGAVDSAFHVGEVIVVKINSVESFDYAMGNRVYKLHKITASRRDAEIDPAELYFDQYKQGDTYRGIVTSDVTDYGIFVNVDGRMDVLCSVPVGRIPYRGEPVKVIIRRKDTEKHRLGGVIIL